MQSAVVPRDEARRLDALRAYQPFETAPDAAFDDLPALAAHICAAPMAAISLVDRDAVWFTSTFGWPIGAMGRDASFCAHAILEPDVFVVPDTDADRRFADNPLVTGDTHVRFYAAAPLTTAGGHTVGVLCVMDRSPRSLSPSQREALRILSRHVMAQLDRRRQTRALAERDARYRTLFDHAPDGIIVGDADGRCLDANAGACRMLGYTRDEIQALRTSDIVEASAGEIEAARRSVAERRSYRREWQLRRKDGTMVPADVTVARTPAGDRIAMIHDLSERRTLENQYQQARKLEAVGRLAAGVAHDFNNQLTAILGYCELLLERIDPASSIAADVSEIYTAGTAATALTRQLVAFSRKQIVEPTRLDLNEVVRDIRKMVGRVIGEDVTIALSLSPEAVPVRADRGHLEQVVLNLAVKARDAMPKGGRLTIQTARVYLDDRGAAALALRTSGRHVALTMTDTGVCPSSESRASASEPVRTAAESGRRDDGLAAVRGIVTLYGGSLDVRTEHGTGTASTIYLPESQAAVSAAPPEAPAPRPRTGTQTVLIVEDADGVRDLARRLLERQGYTVLLAANATEALMLVEQHPHIDVLLTDVVMPGKSGPELTSALRDKRPDLKTIYMSGYPQDAIAHHGLAEPGIAFLQKPFTAETLGRKVRDVIDR